MGRSFPSSGRGRRRWWRSPVAVVAALVFAGYWAIAALVIGSDVRDIYPWGVEPRLASRHPLNASIDLFSVAAKDRASNFILVGGSTTMRYTPEQLERSFPGAHNAWNLSYSGSRPVDRDTLLRLLAESGTPRRILVSLDWSYALDPDEMRAGFSAYLYDRSALNDLKMINRDTLGAIRTLARTGRLGIAAKQPQAGRGSRWQLWHSPARLAAMRRSIALHNPMLAAAGRPDCDALVPLADQLVPMLKKLAARGNRIDLLVPPYSPLIYYPVAGSRDRSQETGDGFFADQLLLRRCAVTMTANIPGVAVWAPDRDLSLIADFDGFDDPGHLGDAALLTKTLQAVGDERYRLTTANVGAYIDALRAFTMTYRLPPPAQQPSDRVAFADPRLSIGRHPETRPRFAGQGNDIR